MSSRRQLTLAALATLLEEITVANGFNTDAGEMVHLGQDVELGENDPGPAILVISGIEKFDPAATKLYSAWPISIRAVAGVVDNDFDEAWTIAELVVADIEKAVETADRTLGGLINWNGAHGLILDSIQTVERDAGSSVVAVDVVYIARLQRTWGDPLGAATELVLAS